MSSRENFFRHLCAIRGGVLDFLSQFSREISAFSREIELKSTEVKTMTNIITYPSEMVEEYYQEANAYLVVA